MLYAAIRPRSSRITGNMRGSKPVKMTTRQPAACSLATAGSNSEASTSTSTPLMMSFPPAARLTRSGASSTARGTCSATTSLSRFPLMARLAYRNPGRCADRAPADPVGPAPETAAGIGVVEPFGEAVTDRHERIDSGYHVTFRHPLHDAIPNRH